MARVPEIRGGPATPLVLYLLDALLLQQGAITFVVGWILFAYGAIDLWRGRGTGLSRKGLRTMVVYAALDLAVFGTIHGNDVLAESRRATVVGAIDRYLADEGHYPRRLEDLVPRYLPSVPLARIAPWGGFRYYVRDGDNLMLSYWVLPPFGSLCYNFDAKRWRFLD